MVMWSCSGPKSARFEAFIHNAESVMRLSYALRVIRNNKNVPI